VAEQFPQLEELDARHNPLTAALYFATDDGTDDAIRTFTSIDDYDDEHRRKTGEVLGARTLERRQRYRAGLIRRLRRLVVLDGIAVSGRERAQAEAEAGAGVAPVPAPSTGAFGLAEPDSILDGLPPFSRRVSTASVAEDESPSLLFDRPHATAEKDAKARFGTDFSSSLSALFTDELAGAPVTPGLPVRRRQGDDAAAPPATTTSEFFDDIARRLARLGAPLSSPPEAATHQMPIYPRAPSPAPASVPEPISLQQLEEAIQRAMKPLVERVASLEQFALRSMGQTPVQPSPPQAPQQSQDGVRILKDNSRGIAFTVDLEDEQPSHGHRSPVSTVTPSRESFVPETDPRQQRRPAPFPELGLAVLFPRCFTGAQMKEYDTICSTLIDHLLAVQASVSERALPRKVCEPGTVEYEACARLVRLQSCSHIRFVFLPSTLLPLFRHEQWNKKSIHCDIPLKRGGRLLCQVTPEEIRKGTCQNQPDATGLCFATRTSGDEV
jgi:hypothetical protein